MGTKITETKHTSSSTIPSTVGLIFGISSLVLTLVPVLGLLIGTTGAILAAVQIRQFAFGKKTSGYGKWSAVPGITKAALIVSAVGIVAGAFVTVFGLFVIGAGTYLYTR